MRVRIAIVIVCFLTYLMIIVGAIIGALVSAGQL